MEEWDYLGGHGDLYDNVMMENPHPVIILDGLHSVVSVPDLEISNRTDDITDTGGKNNNPGDAEAATNPSQTSLPSEKGNPADIDPTDIMGEPASRDGSVVRSHTGDNPFICSECGNVLSTKYDLNEHYRIHEIFKCIACGRSFSSHEDLVLHQRIHTGERPFKCTECGKGFTRAAHLVAHKVIHTGVKRFQCNECGATFNRSSNLKSHKWIHTGEKPFKCNVCGIGFTRAFILSKHKMIHEGDSQFICSDCGKVFTMWQHFIQHQEMHKI